MSTTKRLCPQCGTQVQPGQNFCGNCGAPYSETPAADRSEANTPMALPPMMQRADGQPDLAGEATVRVPPSASQPAPARSAYSIPRRPLPDSVEAEQRNAFQPGQVEFPYAGASYPHANEPAFTPASNPAANGPAFPPMSGAAMPPVNGPAFTPVNRPDGPPVNGPVFMPAGSPPPATGTTSYYNNSPGPYPPLSFYGQPGQPQPPIGYPPYMAPGAPRKRINPLFIALGIVLVVMVVLCGVLAFTLNSALAPVSRTPSGDTVAATPTAPPTPTGKPVLDDNFGDNTNNWDLFQRSGYGAAIQQHMLVMTEGNGKMFLEHVPGAQAMTDFQIDMTYTQQNNDRADVGVFFRRQTATSPKLRGYVLMIATGTGRYSIRKIVDPSASTPSGTTNPTITLSSGTLDNTVQLNKPVQATLLVQGSNMKFYVNGKLITTCDDNTSTAPYDTGSINLLLQGSTDGVSTKVAFSHFALYDSGSGGPSI